jgi:hypothetical protein
MIFLVRLCYNTCGCVAQREWEGMRWRKHRCISRSRVGLK